MQFRAAFAFAASLGARIALAGVPPCPVADGLPPTNISIPAQPLNQALQALAAQTGLDILFEPATVAGLRGAAVHGQMRPGDALCLLLDDSGLVYSINSDRTVVITRRASTVDRTRAPASELNAAAASATGAGAPSDVWSETAPADSTVIVTGTRRNDRSAADSLVPIDIIGSDSLAQLGTADLAQGLSVLVPSLNYPQPALTDGTDVIRPATLRGLGPDQMLVLVNGKRRHVSALLNINSSVGRGTAAVDMSLLPAAAIERVEVLRDGAAAQYGSDAIAGVVNVLLKERREGGDIRLSYGQRYTDISGVPRATGLQKQPNGQPIRQADGVYALDYNGRREAHDGGSLTLSGSWGLELGPDGFIDVSVQARDQEPTNRAGFDPRRQYALDAAGRVDPRELTFNRLSQRFGDPRVLDAEDVLNTRVPLADTGFQLYAFATYGARRGETDGFYRMSDDPRTVPELFPDGFLARVILDLEDEALTTGLRGDWLGWNYDAGLTYGRSAIDFTTQNSDNASLGVASPTRFADGGLRYEESGLNVDLQRPLASGLFDKALSVAWGIGLRSEHFAIRPGEPASYEQGPVLLSSGQPAAAGAQVFPGFRPEDASDHARHSANAYVDLEQDLNGRVDLALAARAERYSDFGSTVNYEAAGRVKLTGGLALRGSLSTGFRAPSLHQQYFSATSTNDIGGRLFDVGTFAVTDGVARALGARDLKPETSRNLGFGLVFDRIDRLALTLDWYRIAINDRIVLTQNLGTDGTPEQNTAVQALLARAGYPFISGARFFINGIDTRTQGLDIVGTYRLNAPWLGQVMLSAGYNHTMTRIARYIDNLSPLSQIPGLVLFGRLESERLERGQPSSKLNLSAEWRREMWSGTVRANRYGEVLAPGADPRDDLLMRSAWVADVELRYSPGHWQAALGAENLFDTYPTPAPTGARPPSLGGYYNVNNYILPFSVFAPFGFSGRYVYGRLGYRF